MEMGIAAPAFADDPLVAGMTLVKVAHVTQLRQTIDSLRSRYPAPGTFVWTDAALVAGVGRSRPSS
jgi:hypothetical protein